MSKDNNQELDYLTEKEINLLIKDIEIITQGGFPIFAIDTYDIISYCFPYTLDNSNRLSHIRGDLSFDLYAYTEVFENYEYNPVVLDEYRGEIKGIEQKANTLTKSYNNKNKFIENLRNEFDKTDDKLSFFDKNLTKILALKNGLFRENKQRFKKLLDERLQITNFTLFNPKIRTNISEDERKDQKELHEIIFSTKANPKITKEIFYLFKEKISSNLKYFDKRDKRDKYDLTTLTDIKAMVRLNEINKRIKNSYNNGFLTSEYRFLFLSSTPEKSEILQNLYVKVVKKLDGFKKKDGEYLLRNIYQISWLLIFCKYFKNANDRTIAKMINDLKQQLIDGKELIESINKKIKHKETTINNYRKLSNDDTLNFGNRLIYENLLKEIENAKINNDDNINYENLLKEIENAKINDDDNINDIFNSLIELLKSTKENKDELKDNLFLKNSSLKLYNVILSDKPHTPFGKDIVKSKLQRLPLLFFHSIKIQDSIKKDFTKQYYSIIRANASKKDKISQ